MSLDLIVSVDTMTAHLAGALGKPVWTLLPADCDWRWMESRSDSPWYPTMRLFRQSQAGEWRDVLDNVVAELDHRRRSRPDRAPETGGVFLQSATGQEPRDEIIVCT
jgi:ADP-heptose:LPS heptosyltransferase